jgi:hypothetical protein
MTLDLDTLKRQMAEQKAKDALLTARATLERSLRELDQYIERLDAADTAHDKSQVMNWALNALVCNITPDGHFKFPHLWPPQIPPGKTAGL